MKKFGPKFWRFVKIRCMKINQNSFLAIYNWYNLKKLFSYPYNMLFVSNCIETIKGKTTNFFWYKRSNSICAKNMIMANLKILYLESSRNSYTHIALFNLFKENKFNLDVSKVSNQLYHYEHLRGNCRCFDYIKTWSKVEFQ